MMPRISPIPPQIVPPIRSFVRARGIAFQLIGWGMESLIVRMGRMNEGHPWEMPMTTIMEVDYWRWKLKCKMEAILLAISREGSNQFREAICHLKALNVF
jgi:hypothetical protein